MNRRPSAQRLFDPARIALWLGLILPVLAAIAAEQPGPANRFLLVVETSRSMQRRVQAMTQTVRDLLGSGLGGQARPGDTLGVWTFNEELHTGMLPLQEWSNPNLVRDRVAGFLVAQKFEKRARFDQVIPALQRVVRNSPFLTVIVVCLGDEAIHGTPFDPQINNFFRTWQTKEPDAGTPFVIGLRAQNGKLVDCSMNPFPWPVELPALPKELITARSARPPPAVREPAKPVAPTVPPLIISGRKREAQPSVKTEEPAPTNVNSAAPLTAVAPPAPGNGTSSGDTTKVVPNSVASTADATSKVSASPPAEPASPSPAVPPPAVPAGGPGTSLAVSGAPQVVPSQSLEAPGKLGSVPGVEPSEPRAAQPQDQTVAANPRLERRPSAPPEPGAGGPRPLELAAATRSASRVSWPVLAGLGLLAVSAAFAAIYYVCRRRARSGEEISLITESFDQGKRPRD